MNNKPIIWSYGGGTQSAAIAAAILRGDLPRPERAVMADTGREASATWDYLETVVQPALDAIGLTIEIISQEYATVGLYAKNGDLLIPAHTNQSGKRGMMPTFCSNEWKRRPVERYLRANGYGTKNPVTMWLGMSVDEIERCKVSSTSWIEHAWPLVFDLRMRRHDCKRICLEMGWPEPPKSSCWMCPHRSNQQWKNLKENYPADFSAAASLEAEIRELDQHAYLHRDLLPIAEVEFPEENEMTLWRGCESGYCFV